MQGDAGSRLSDEGVEAHGDVAVGAPSTAEPRRDRILSALVLLVGALLFIALPFALHAGAGFFLPIVAAAVVSLALSPLADWLQFRGLPNWAAALLALVLLVLIAIIAGGSVIQPAIGMLDMLPQSVERIAGRADEITKGLVILGNGRDGWTARAGVSDFMEFGSSFRTLLQDMLLQTPGVMAHIFVTLLLAYFMIEARGRLKRQLLLDRNEYLASLRAARVLHDVQAMVRAYFTTTFAVAAAVGVIVGLAAWAFGWQSPVMWGGLAAILNMLPYVGPLTMTLLLALFGLMGDGTLLLSLVPCLAYLGLHAVESNVVTPILMGRRLDLSPVAILASLLFFGWVWGVVGVFLAVPLLLVISAFLNQTGRPNLIGFLFGEPLFRPARVAAEPAGA